MSRNLWARIARIATVGASSMIAREESEFFGRVPACYDQCFITNRAA